MYLSDTTHHIVRTTCISVRKHTETLEQTKKKSHKTAQRPLMLRTRKDWIRTCCWAWIKPVSGRLNTVNGLVIRLRLIGGVVGHDEPTVALALAVEAALVVAAAVATEELGGIVPDKTNKSMSKDKARCWLDFTQ